jgi:hypothetical protein
MRASVVVLTATFCFLAAVTSAPAACRTDRSLYVGAVSGDGEKDSFGHPCATGEVDRTGSGAGPRRGDVQRIGMSTGDVEKDTVGYMLGASTR